MQMKMSSSVQNWTPVWILLFGSQTGASAFEVDLYSAVQSDGAETLIWISCLSDYFSADHIYYLVHAVQQIVVEIGASVRKTVFEKMFQLSLKITTKFYKKPSLKLSALSH